MKRCARFKCCVGCGSWMLVELLEDAAHMLRVMRGNYSRSRQILEGRRWMHP